jgi:uncharacterized membrane protein
MHAELLILRLVHVLGGLFWVGSGLFTTFYLMPALASAGPAAGQVMAGLQKRRLFTVLPLVALLTILSGLRLMWITSAGFSSAYLDSANGRTLIAGGVAAIAAFVLSLLVARPAAVRSAALGASLAGMPEGEARAAAANELAALRRRTTIASHTAVALLLLAASSMAVARYLG